MLDFSNRVRNPKRATIDYETRSACDLRKSGAWKYSEHDTTEIMCMAVIADGFEFVWNPPYPNAGIEERNRDKLDEFLAKVGQGHFQIEAHNSGFERAIWKNVAAERLEWPEIPHELWRCSAALAASHAIPRSLAGAADSLGLDQVKDDKGARVMKKISKPRLPLKADMALVAQEFFEDATRWKEIPKPKDMYQFKQLYPNVPGVDELCIWHENKDDLEMLFAYCLQDVKTEHALSERLGGDLPPIELKVWQLDQLMNESGMQIDLELADKAIELAALCTVDANKRMSELTGGQVETCTQREQFLKWINSLDEGSLENTQKQTIEDEIQNPEWGDTARKALQVRLDQAKTSVKKYNAMKAVACKDGRAKGLLAYHGADTGRWAGRLIQPQNFPRGSIKGDMGMLCNTILTGDRDSIELMYGPTMEAMSSALRGAMIAGPGKDLICSDYSAIEARGTFWISNDKSALNVLSSGRDIYIDMASQIYGIPYEEIPKGSIMRQIGKQAILGLGYQMGPDRYIDTCAGYGIEIEGELAKQIVQTYRVVHAPVRSFWYDLERAAKEVISRGKGGQPFHFKRLVLQVSEDDFFQIQLPSGRKISYYEPRMRRVLSRFQKEEMESEYERAKKNNWSLRRCENEGLRIDNKITFMGVDSLTKKFKKQETYGGKLTENVVQGLSRDIMAEAMLRVYEGGKYFPLLTVHDEIIAEVDKGLGDVDEFEALLSELPEWATGFPVEAADGWIGERYRK